MRAPHPPAMDPDALLSISRQGSILGQFTLRAVRDGLLNGKFRATDVYWVRGMAGWDSLDKLPAPAEPKPEEPPPATEPSATAGASSPSALALPPPPAAVTARPGSAPPAIPKAPSSPQPASPANPAWKARGNGLIVVGALVFLYGLLADPQGSAIRQQVLVQHMTNGLLFAIAGLLVRKLD